MTLHLSLILTRKIWQFRLVSRWIWAEAAAWKSKASSLGPALKFFKYGFRWTNKVFGCSVGIWI